jgi:3-phosphoshikimate 1-carboxyvinyltransferase
VIATVRGARKLAGELTLPGDKSISHRALILGAIALGRSHLRGLSSGADVESTKSCVAALGAEHDGEVLNGVGMHGLHASGGTLDCGNSGTTMRLLAGLLAGQEFASELTGDESLSRRPMDRVVEPLRRMGAQASWPPLRVGGTTNLSGIEYVMPVASAQVKSAVLVAALYAEGKTVVVEPAATRNHTELMLRAMGADVTVDGLRIEVAKTGLLEPLDIDIPGDFSAAAFWLVAAGLIRGSRVKLLSVGVNPTRTALAGVLRASGVRITESNPRLAGSEPVADLLIESAPDLRPLALGEGIAAALIDELPVLAVAATQIPGRTVIAGAAELRVKESNRLVAVAEGLTEMGADITATDDGWIIQGPRFLEGAKVTSRGDHRVAMAFAVAGLLADGKTEIDDAECVDISYPGFFDDLEYLC